MASVGALLLVVVLTPLAVLLVAVAARGVSSLARAHLAWPAVSPFTYVVDSARRRKHARRAAPEQRNHELRVSLYRRRKESDSEEEAVDQCVFCLSGVEEGDEVRELRCRHVFHRGCLDRWLARPPATCPLCRSRILTPRAGDGAEEEEEEEDSDLVLLMAYVHGGSGWFWSP